MNPLKPTRLNDGDNVGVVARSFPVKPFQKMHDQGIRNSGTLDFRVIANMDFVDQISNLPILGVKPRVDTEGICARID